jgi:hypothetical protein
MALQRSSTDTNYIDSPEFSSDALKGLSYLLPGAGQALAGIFGAISGKKALNQANSEFESAYKNAPAFQISPEIKQDLAQREAEYNAEDEATKQAKAEQQQLLANYMAGVQRNAQSGAQALGSTAGFAGTTQENMARLAAQQYANKLQRGQGLTAARGAMSQQRALQFADQQAKNEAMQNLALGKMQAARYNVNEANKNIFSGLPSALTGLAGLLGNKESENKDNELVVIPNNFNINPSSFRTPDMNWNKKQPLETITTTQENLPKSVPTNQSVVMNNPLPADSGLAAPVNPYANPWNMQNASLINRPFGSVGPTNQNYDDLPIDVKMKIEALKKRKAYEESPMGSVPLNPSMMLNR